MRKTLLPPYYFPTPLGAPCSRPAEIFRLLKRKPSQNVPMFGRVWYVCTSYAQGLSEKLCHQYALLNKYTKKLHTLQAHVSSKHEGFTRYRVVQFDFPSRCVDAKSAEIIVVPASPLHLISHSVSRVQVNFNKIYLPTFPWKSVCVVFTGATIANLEGNEH